jgi:protein SCO1/2
MMYRIAYRFRVLWIASVLGSLALIASNVTPGEATPQLRGRIVGVRAPATVFVAAAASARMPAMSMPFLVTRGAFATLRRGMEITAVVRGRTSPPTLSQIRVVTALATATRYVPELQLGDTVPDFALVDQRGHAFSLSRFRGQALVLSFIYTRCRDATMCSLVSAKFSQLQRRLGRDPIHLMEITLDPAYDTPRILARYGAVFDAKPARWTLATGEASAAADLAARAGIVTTETPRGIVHSEAVLIVDPKGRLTQIIGGDTWSADDLLTEARATFGAAPSPIARLWLWLRSGVAAVCGGSSGISTATALAIFIVILIVASLSLRRLLRARISRT